MSAFGHKKKLKLIVYQFVATIMVGCVHMTHESKQRVSPVIHLIKKDFNTEIQEVFPILKKLFQNTLLFKYFLPSRFLHQSF